MGNDFVTHSSSHTVEQMTSALRFDLFYNVGLVHAYIKVLLDILSFKWIQTDFLGYLEQWERAMEERKGFTVGKKKLCF